jgi:hypothetical protein
MDVVSIETSFVSSSSLQALRESIQRSIDTKAPVAIAVGDHDMQDVTFGEYTVKGRQAAGTTHNNKVVLVNFPPKELESTGKAVIVVGH